MMKFSKFLLPAVLLVSTQVQAYDADQIRSDIRKKCVAEWGADYSMIEYCENKQIEALVKWADMLGNVTENDILVPVASNCDREWPDDYSMKVYCLEKQMKSITNLGKFLDMDDNTVNAIVVRCMDEWDEDYSMVEYCSNKQIKSYNNLNR